MTREIQYNKVTLNVREIDSTSFTKEFLLECGVIEDFSVITNNYFVSGNRTNISLSNESLDSFEVNPYELQISSSTFDRIVDIIEMIQPKLNISRINNLELEMHEHFEDESLPDAIFRKYSTNDIVGLDAIQFKNARKGIRFVIYSCNKNIIHTSIYQKIFGFAYDFEKLNFRDLIKSDEFVKSYNNIIDQEFDLKNA